MRNNREKWQFYSHPSKPEMSSAEVRYWKEAMRRLLKVGMEFEFNLPDQKGRCKGDNVQCPCVHVQKECWKKCSNITACKEIPCFDSCSKKSKCKPDDCGKCTKYKFKCIGTTCVDFVSACFTCTKFNKNCDTCEKKYQPEKDPKHIRQILKDELRPSQTYGIVGQNGVVSVTTDGSLLGDKGVEIITVGRRVDYWEFYMMSKKILDKVTTGGGYLNERTGSHMHVLTSYYDNEGSNEMEKPMPQIVLANFHQLCRRYQNALTWMTIALSDPKHMTRWEKFRVSVLGVSPVTKDIRRMMEDVSRHAGGNKYGFINYNSMRFSDNDDIDRFHVEFRQADSAMSPTYYAALACLHYAMVIKAVEISRYGLLKVGDESWLKKAKAMKNIIMNGCGDYADSDRMSDTRKLLDHTGYFIDESLDLVNQMKSTLMKVGPAYDVLIKLAEKPVALRRIEGTSWEDIENALAVEMQNSDHLEVKLGEIIDLKLVDDCKSAEEWMEEVQKCLSESNDMNDEIDKSEIESFVDIKMREGELIWSESTGCMMAV